MPGPLHSQAPALFWFYRLAGFGAVAGAVWLGRRNRSGLGDPPTSNEDFCSWAQEEFPARSKVVLTEDIGVSRSQIIRAGDIATVKRVDCSSLYPKIVLQDDRHGTVFDVFFDSSYIPFSKLNVNLIRGKNLNALGTRP